MLTQDQKSKYEQIRQMALSDLETIDRAIEAELAEVKKRLLQLQEDKKAVKQILDGACARLGGVAEPVPHAADAAETPPAKNQAGALDELAVFER